MLNRGLKRLTVRLEGSQKKMAQAHNLEGQHRQDKRT